MAGTAPLPERSPFQLAEAFFIGGMLVAIWMMPQWVWEGEIRITGLRRVTQAAIAARLLPHRGKPLHALDVARMRADLRELDAVEDAEIRRWLLPARLEVKITERDPRSRATGSLTGWYLDSEGRVFRMDPAWIINPLPLGVRLATASWQTRERQAYRDILERWPADRPGELDALATGSWKVHLDGVTVHLGQPTDIPAKWAAYRTVWDLARQGGKRLEYIDVQLPDAPSVRPARPSPRPSPVPRER